MDGFSASGTNPNQSSFSRKGNLLAHVTEKSNFSHESIYLGTQTKLLGLSPSIWTLLTSELY